MSITSKLTYALHPFRSPASPELTSFTAAVTENAVGKVHSVAALVALAKAAELDAATLDGVAKQLMTGKGNWGDTDMTVRGKLAKVLSGVIEGVENSEPAAPVAPVAPVAPSRPGGKITLTPEREQRLNALDRKYIAAFEAAGIVTTLDGGRNGLDEASMKQILQVVEGTPGFSMGQFLIDIVYDSQALGFGGVTRSRYDNAAAHLLAAADKYATQAKADGKDEVVEKLATMRKVLTDSKKYSKADISATFAKMDQIFAADPTAAAQGLRGELARDRMGATLRGKYDFHLSHDASVLTVDPYVGPPPMMTRSATRSAVVSQESAIGGRELMLVDDSFASGKWEQRSLRELAANNPRFLKEMQDNRFDMERVRDVLVVEGKDDPHPIFLVFSAAGDGVLTICKDCAFHPFADGVVGGGGGGGGPIMVRKPVVYLYPKETQTVRVDLEVAGRFVAQYPAMNRRGGWEVVATPSGELTDPARGKKYSYLFWEAERSTPFALDHEQAFLVARENVESFLDKVAESYALNEKERTDFVSYWIAPLQQNSYSIVQLLDSDTYGKYAHMRISPEPDAVIRLFMIFKSATGLERVGNPSLPEAKRQGFTVVEWGGANLDEKV